MSSELKPGTICRIINSHFAENINKLVTVVGPPPLDWQEQFPEGGLLCETLQPMLGWTHSFGIHIEAQISPGTQMHFMPSDLQPLGDDGKEERDLFGVPADGTPADQLAALTKLAGMVH